MAMSKSTHRKSIVNCLTAADNHRWSYFIQRRTYVSCV